MKSGWHRGRGDDQHAPVEMRFIDMFMTALGSLVFIALLLVFLLPKTTQQNKSNNELEKAVEQLISENQQLKQQMQLRAQLTSPGGGKTEDFDIMRRWFGVVLVTSGCGQNEPEMYARVESKMIDVKTGAPAPDPVEFDASNPSNKTIVFGSAYFNIGDGPDWDAAAIKSLRSVQSNGVAPIFNAIGADAFARNGTSAKLFYGSTRAGGSSWSVYVGLKHPESLEGDTACLVQPVFLTYSEGLLPGDKLALTKRQPFAWLRHFKMNMDGTTTLGTLPKDDEEFKRALADFSEKQSGILLKKKGLCNTVDANFALLVSAQSRQNIANPKRPPSATLWNYGDSTVYLVSDPGGHRQFYFDTPSCEESIAGATPGWLLFDGKYSADNGKKTYAGTAYAYSPGCTAKSYPVDGEVSDDFAYVSLKGKEPILDANCKVTGTRGKALNFTLQASVDGGLAAGAHSESFSECENCPEMVAIAAGSFLMGSEGVQKPLSSPQPQHIVNIANAFAIGKFEVTVAQFAKFVRETGYDAGTNCFRFNKATSDFSEATGSWREPGFPQTSVDPVACINWYDAKAYVKWLAAKTREQYRLLSEAEWEYAARAGTTSNFYFGVDSKVLCKYGNVRDRSGVEAWAQALSKPENPNGSDQLQAAAGSCDDGFIYTSRVGSFPPNAYGLYDMYGNVWETVEDCVNESYSGAPKDGSAWLSGDCKHRIRRGGSFYTEADSATGFPGIAEDRVADVGFRVARSITPADDCREGLPVLAIFSCTQIIAAKQMSAGNVAAAYQNRGLAYLKLHQYDKAIADYDIALRTEPKQAMSYYGRGLARQSNGDRIAGDADIAAAKMLNASIDKDFASRLSP